MLGYAECRNFTKVINKARTACETTGHDIADHFIDVNKMVAIGSGTECEIEDFMLTRFACHLIAQNSDPQKEPIAFVQNNLIVGLQKEMKNIMKLLKLTLVK